MAIRDAPAAVPRLADETVQAFQSSLRGNVLRPDDGGYDDARRVWNAMVDRRPALIARCAGTADVIASVRFAREHGLLVSIKGGGHSVAGKAVCDGGLMIDLSPMQGIRVDPVRRTARAEGGVTWGAFDRETQAFGLATTGGVIPSTGIAGLTLGGGLGFLMRRFGLACDNLLAADVVTADGELVHASADEHPDLHWGLRGGGGNFGIVTSFEYQLHPVGPAVLGGIVLHPFAHAREVMRFYREFTATAPDELTTYLGFGTLPDGQQTVALVNCYSGPIAAGEAVLKPLRAFGHPLVDMIGPLPYTGVQSLFETAYPPGRQNYWKSSFLAELGDGVIEGMIERFPSVPSPFSTLGLEHLGGAVARVGADATAFGDREATYSLLVTGSWEDPADSPRNVQWVRESWELMRPHAKDSVYVNYVDTGEDERIKTAYGPNYVRLVAVKATYDPDNVFRQNHNIRPES